MDNAGPRRAILVLVLVLGGADVQLAALARDGALRELARVADDGQAPVQVLDDGHEEELLREDVDAARPALHARVRALRLLAVGLELAARVALAELREEVRPARASSRAFRNRTAATPSSGRADGTIEVFDAAADENA